MPWLNRETKRLANLDWKARHPGHWREGQLRRLYGIGWADYLALLARQSAKCAICGTDEPGGRGIFCVDHDHVSGRVRGLLCNACNRGIGTLGDNPVRLRAAAEYLEKGSGPDPLPSSE